MPGTKSKNTASEIVETVNYSSGKYSVNHWSSKDVVIKAAKASELQYATINFDSINLSEHTKLTVEAWCVPDASNPTAGKKDANKIDLGTNGTISGKKNLTNFSVQIPLDSRDGYLYVVTTLVSQGQVNTDNNNGYVLRDIVGVYNPTTTEVDGGNEKVSGVTINWAKNEKVMYELPIALTDGNTLTQPAYDVLNTTYNPNGNEGYTFEYSVPAFPYTGNAVITVYDTNKKAIAYWAMPTTNQSKVAAVKDEDGNITGYEIVGYRNKNVLVDVATNLYQISENEAKNINVGTVTTDANGDAKVDSTATGVTHVIGTIVSTNQNVVIDATNSKLYSSVQWNPIPNAAAPGYVAPRTAGAALVGQQITLNAQLADRNGNPVKTAGVKVNFFHGENAIDADTLTLTDANGKAIDVISCDTETDAAGKAKLVLTAPNAASLIGLKATAGDTGYILAYTLGTETVTADWVDLYWLDANLGFTYNANYWPTANTSADTPYVDTKDVQAITPSAGTNWDYAVNTIVWNAESVYGVGGHLNRYKYDGISGLTINTTVGDGSVGTVTNAANGFASVTSKQAGFTYLENVLDSTSVTGAVTFTFVNQDNWSKLTLPNIGEGTPNLDKKLTLDINWDAADTTASIIIPTGVKGATGTIKNVFVKVVDAFGNPIKDKVVTLTNSVETDGNIEVKTDANGIAPFTVDGSAKTAGQSTTITAKVDGVKNLTVSKSIKWVTPNATTLAIESAVYDYTTKTVTLKFSDYIEKASVVKDMFTVMYGDDAAAKEQIIGEVKVSGKTVTLTLPALTNLDKTTAFTVSIGSDSDNDGVVDSSDVTVDSITYTLAATDGEVATGIITTPDADGDGTPDNITVK